MVHRSVLSSAVTAHGTFGTQSGNFLTSSRVSQNTWMALSLSAGASHSVVNWHRPVSCADDNERNAILLAIDDYHQKTTIRFKQYDPITDPDYINITGEDSGCWSSVGRRGGVSSRVQDVVKTSPALRTAPLGFAASTPTKTNSLLFPSHSKSFPHLWENQIRDIRFRVTHSQTSCEFTKDQLREAESWPAN